VKQLTGAQLLLALNRTLTTFSQVSRRPTARPHTEQRPPASLSLRGRESQASEQRVLNELQSPAGLTGTCPRSMPVLCAAGGLHHLHRERH